MSIYDVFSGGGRAFNKEEWAAAKQEQRREAYELIDNTCAEIAADGGMFQRYLDVQGHFDRYSVNNAILVSAQMPEATQLKDYGSWKQSRVYVDKDAKKITILEPGKEYQREDGSKAVGYNVILSILVDTFFSRISLTMLPVPNPHNTSCVLS